MRVLIDTNVLFSALLFPLSKPAIALRKAVSEHTVVLCEQNIVELREIISRKAPNYLSVIDAFFAEFQFELIPSVENSEIIIRDAKDQPILNASIAFDVDLIITGDKDFLALEMNRPIYITAASFIDQF